MKLARLFAELGHNEEIPYPDISTKAKAQKFVSLPAEKLKEEKKLFLEEVVPEWLEKAREREEEYEVKTVNQY
ncbi:MAG: ammonia-forming cytochrome c nitrite reductase subunit c552 [Bacteroidales bacterium]|nr:ammonia-forming cytochrome c nitrite reductase subunit c552 [Bacteroidales bacterium]